MSPISSLKDKSKHPTYTVLIRPGCGAVVFSQERMAKNSPTIAKSAAMAGGVSCVTSNASPARVYIPRNNFGVMALCR